MSLLDRMIHEAVHCDTLYDTPDVAEVLREAVKEIERLTADLCAAQKDAERLEWAQNNAFHIEEYRELDGSSVWIVDHSAGMADGETLRAALDDAMKEQKT